MDKSSETSPVIQNRDFLQIVLKPCIPFMALLFLCGPLLAATKIAVVTPQKNDLANSIRASVATQLEETFSVLNSDMVDSIFGFENFERPFNLSSNEAKRFGERVGSNFVLLIRAESFRRSTFERNKYFEAYAAYYLVNSNDGVLVDWIFRRFEKDTAEEARASLLESTSVESKRITTKVKERYSEVGPKEGPEVMLFSGTDPKGPVEYRPPLPYNRIKPKYTDLASLYDILATVDAVVEFDRGGKVREIKIVRWAGFGLEESVIKTIKEMEWRPGERNGVPLPMRVLLRYNFKNLDTEE